MPRCVIPNPQGVVGNRDEDVLRLACSRLIHQSLMFTVVINKCVNEKKANGCQGSSCIDGMEDCWTVLGTTGMATVFCTSSCTVSCYLGNQTMYRYIV